MVIFENEKQKIITAINNAAKDKYPNGIICPICKNDHFILVDGFVNTSFQKELSGSIIIGGPSLPSAVVICDNCGFTMNFNLGVLKIVGDKK